MKGEKRTFIIENDNIPYHIGFFYSGFKQKTIMLIAVKICRFLESHWFVWVTQMSHLPKEIDHERRQDWLTMQVPAL